MSDKLRLRLDLRGSHQRHPQGRPQPSLIFISYWTGAPPGGAVNGLREPSLSPRRGIYNGEITRWPPKISWSWGNTFNCGPRCAGRWIRKDHVVIFAKSDTPQHISSSSPSLWWCIDPKNHAKRSWPCWKWLKLCWIILNNAWEILLVCIMIMTTIQIPCDKILDLLGWGEKEKYFCLQKCFNYNLSKFYFFQI